MIKKKSWKNFLREGLLLIAAIAIAIPLGKYMVIVYEKYQLPPDRGDYSLHVANRDYHVTLYGTSTCRHCKDMRAFLNARHIKFNDIILDEQPHAQASYKLLRLKMVPVLVTKDGYVAGFKPEQVEKLLAEGLNNS